MGNADTALDPRPTAADRRFDFRILITGALIAGLCAMFWIGSRYPSLQGKASADPNEALSTPLGFERLFPEPPRDQRLRHIGDARAPCSWERSNEIVANSPSVRPNNASDMPHSSRAASTPAFGTRGSSQICLRRLRRAIGSGWL